ncbi:sensor histidine kinase [Cryomorphaceae bacterium 1068]|nr:sensor histidine kinase [Cryomorphaceae bacterium 1068]
MGKNRVTPLILLIFDLSQLIIGRMQSEEFVLIFGTSLFLILAGFIVLFAVQYRKEQLKFTIEKQRFKQEILQAEVEIREKTLEDVGKELHDNLGQIASLTRINLAGMRSGHSNPEKVDQSITLMDKLIEEMRNLSHQLNDGVQMRLSLSEQIEQDVRRLNNLEGLEVCFSMNAPALHMSGDKAVLIYRIFQEALSNVLKHSQANELSIRVEEEEKNIKLTVEDNGIGLPVENLKQDGIGMKNMRSRAALLGAEFSVSNRNPKGTALSLKLNKEKLNEQN